MSNVIYKCNINTSTSKFYLNAPLDKSRFCILSSEEERRLTQSERHQSIYIDWRQAKVTLGRQSFMINLPLSPLIARHRSFEAVVILSEALLFAAVDDEQKKRYITSHLPLIFAAK